MICQTCKDQIHEKCRGGTWCDCLHRAHPSPVTTPMSPEEYAQALADLAEVRRRQKELRGTWDGDFAGNPEGYPAGSNPYGRPDL